MMLSSFTTLLAAFLMTSELVSSAPTPLIDDTPSLMNLASRAKTAVTIKLALKKAHVGAHNEHWILTVTADQELSATDTNALGTNMKGLGATKELSIQGNPYILAEKEVPNPDPKTAKKQPTVKVWKFDTTRSIPWPDDIFAPTPASVKNTIKLGSAKFDSKGAYSDWLKSLKKIKLSVKPVDEGGNCIDFLDQVLKSLLQAPGASEYKQADYDKFKAEKDKDYKRVHKATWVDTIKAHNGWSDGIDHDKDGAAAGTSASARK